MRKVHHSTYRTVPSRDKSTVTAPAALFTFRYVIPVCKGCGYALQFIDRRSQTTKQVSRIPNVGSSVSPLVPPGISLTVCKSLAFLAAVRGWISNTLLSPTLRRTAFRSPFFSHTLSFPLSCGSAGFLGLSPMPCRLPWVRTVRLQQLVEFPLS